VCSSQRKVRAGAEDHGLGDAEAAGGLLAVGGVALAGVAERQELREDGLGVHADAVVLPGERAALGVPGDLEAAFARAELLAGADRGLDGVDAFWRPRGWRAPAGRPTGRRSWS
jgi:hypothetical protein